MYDEYDVSDEKWHVRVLAKMAKYAKRMRTRDWMRLCAAALALFLVYTALCFIFGYGDALESGALRASAFYGQLPDHTDAYRWLNESERDALVGEHVIAARSLLVDPEHLVLVGSQTDELRHKSVDIDCTELFSSERNTSTHFATMFLRTTQFLQRNSGPAGSCACGPMFGYSMRYLALGANTKRTGLELSDESGEATEGVVHALNVRDELELAYDALDTEALSSNLVKLAIVNESQSERYNEARGEFSIIRRTRVRLSFLDRLCHRQVVRLGGTLAVCAQRCLDLMRGIDVRERARMQWRLGIRLNVIRLGEPPSQERVDVFRDEL